MKTILTVIALAAGSAAWAVTNPPLNVNVSTNEVTPANSTA